MPIQRNNFFSKGGNNTKPERYAGLTPAQFATMLLLIQDLQAKQVADQLGISVKTVEKHRQAVCNTWGVSGVLQMLAHAQSLGVVSGNWFLHTMLANQKAA